MIIGLQLRHIKGYNGINFIRLGYKHNFCSYVGDNGIGKSSILQAFDYFLNNKDWQINKTALKSGIKGENFPFIAPIFLIPKNKVDKKKLDIFNGISNYFWELEFKSSKTKVDFFELRDSLQKDGYNKNDYFLIFLGLTKENELYIPVLKQEIKEDFKLKVEDGEKFIESEFKDFFDYLKGLYNYIYIPTESDIETFTKIETKEMGKIFNKNIKNDIGELLKDNTISNINDNLNKLVEGLENKFNDEYCYDTGGSRKKFLTKVDLIEKILEVYFQVRVLNKGKKGDPNLRKVSELSSGEKRQALIRVLYAFLENDKDQEGLIRDKMLILGIDEPEMSLSIFSAFDQFEKILKMSENTQILITTHWYGFLPVMNKGSVHFLSKINNGDVFFDSYDLYDYKSEIKKKTEDTEGEFPIEYQLKSINELVQAIFNSMLIKDNPYYWVICEGISDKIYIEYFLKILNTNEKIRILALGGCGKILNLFDYLLLPVKKNKNQIKGKIICITDTDNELQSKIIDNDVKKILRLDRLNNNNGEDTKLLSYSSKSHNLITTIENALNPEIFKKTLADPSFKEKIDNLDIKVELIDITEAKNTDFIYGLQLKSGDKYKLDQFFNINNGEMKILFAKKYIEIMNKLPEGKQGKYIPNWIKDIIDFFNP